MFGHATPRSFLWLVCLYAVLIIGCGGDDDDDDWVGTWSLEAVDGQSLEQSLAEDLEEGITVSIVTNSWTFNSDETVEAEFAVKLAFKEGGSEFAITSSTKIMGTYSLSGPNYTLAVATEGEAADFFREIGGTDEDAGTWSISGNTLTLNSNDGSTIVFKEK